MQQLLNSSTTHFSDPNCIPFTNLSKGSLLALEDMGLRQIFRVVFEDDMSECQPLVEAGFTGGVANCGDKLCASWWFKYIYMYIHNIKCDIFVDSPAYEFLLHVHIDSKGTCCQLPPEAFHAVLDGLSNADKKKFLMFVTGIEAYGLLPYKAGAYPSYNRALLDLYESNEFK